MTTITDDAQRLIARLRIAADVIESAARYSVPIPSNVSIYGHVRGGASFAADDEALFDAWVAYVEQDEPEVENYRHADQDWSRAVVTLGGLEIRFATTRRAAVTA